MKKSFRLAKTESAGSKKGFTLIELLVVIAIIAISAADKFFQEVDVARLLTEAFLPPSKVAQGNTGKAVTNKVPGQGGIQLPPKNRLNRRLVALFLLLFFGILESHALTVTHLSCEDRANPLGIDVAQPRLGWMLQSSQRGDTQTAYQILVASSQTLLNSNTGDLWDSGKVVTNQLNQILYGGTALQTSQQVFWKVRAWDGSNIASAWSANATWTMGVLNSADWQAQWIMGIQRKSIGYHAATSTTQTTNKWVQVDLGQAYPISTIKLHPKWHQGLPGYGFPLRFHVEISNDPTFASSNLVASQTTDLVNPGYYPQSYSVANTSARYVRVTATKLYYYAAGSDYTFALSQLEVLSGGTNVALNASVSDLDTIESSGWGKAGLTDGAGFVGCDYGRRLRREFVVQPGLQRAIVQVSGLGAYEFSVNGVKNGTDLLSPGWSYYGPRPWQVGTNETVLYDTRDITAQIQPGTTNAIGLILGNSFYNVTPGYGRYVKSDFNQNLPFGPLRAIAQIELDYTNGTTQIIGSDANWMSGPGAISFENVYAGEDYDARLEPAGWNQPGYANAEWTPAVLTNGPGGVLKGLSCAAPPVGKFDVFTPVNFTNGQVISWNENDGNTIPSNGSAGVVSATNWNNSNAGMSLSDNTGAASGASFSIAGWWGPWEITAVAGSDATGAYNRTLLSGYANTSSGAEPEVFSITGIPYSAYNVIVYFSSDTAGRAGTISSANAGQTFDFTTIGPASVNGTNAVLTQTTNTTSANPLANYAVFTNVSGSSETLTLSIPNGGGIAGFQIVATSGGWSTKVFDLGQNATVMPQLQVSGPAGSYVQIVPSELLGANGLVDRTTCTQGSTPPLPSYWQYTLKGSGTETWTPQFFIHGCRYLQVQLYAAPGSSTLPTVQSLQGVAVHSTSSPIGSFNCSNPLFNQIFSLVRWAEVNNMESYLSDCPHRERLGWLEQDHLNGPSLRYNFDLAPLFTKIENDIFNSQWTNNGFVPNIGPEYFQTSGSLTDAYHNSPEWGSTFILGAWQQYQFSGDVGLLQRFYPAMKAYLNYLTSTVNGNYIVPTDLGDWYDIGQISSGTQLTTATLPGTAIYYADAVALAQMAQALGYSADTVTYNQLAANIGTGFNATYFNSANVSYDTSSQTANGMPLALGMVNSTNIAGVIAALVNDIQARNNALTSGEVGIGFVFRALEQAGRADVISAMLNQTSTPGYGYQIAHGATALTERWDAANTSFSSQDHFMCGEIMEWFYHGLAGIQPDPTGPGFKKIIINPGIGSGLASATATYNSANGLITNQWTVNNNLAAMNTTIPPGSTALVCLPLTGTNAAVYESGVLIWTNGATATASPNVTFAGILTTNSQTSLLWNIGSGSYQFNWSIFPTPSGLSAVPGNHQVALTWNSVVGADSYNVKRAPVSGGPYSIIASGVAVTNYTDSAVTNGGTYYYVVSANTAGAESGNSFEVSATPQFVFNFGFETPKIGTYQYNPSGGSWTFTAQSGNNGSGITPNGTLFNSSNPSAPEGSQVAFLQSTCAISQAISGFVPGAKYSITFSAAERAGQYQHGGQTWNLKVDSSVVASYSPPATATSYVDYTTNFTATAATHTLSFVGTDLVGGDNTVFLDNVRLAPSPAVTAVTLGMQFSYPPSGSEIQLSWPADHTGWRLQMETNLLGNNWVTVLNANLVNMILLPITNNSAYFRLAYP